MSSIIKGLMAEKDISEIFGFKKSQKKESDRLSKLDNSINLVINTQIPNLLRDIKYNQFDEAGPNWLNIRATIYTALDLIDDEVKPELKKVSDLISNKLRLFDSLPDIFSLRSDKAQHLRYVQKMTLDKEYIIDLLNEYKKLLIKGKHDFKSSTSNNSPSIEPKGPTTIGSTSSVTNKVEPTTAVTGTQTATNSTASTKTAVNPELQKRLAARKAGKPVYSGGLEEGADRQAELEMALQKAKQITKQIKYDDTATDIIVQIQMLAEKFNIDKDSLESAIDDVYNAKNQLESAVYGLDEVFEEALQQSRWDDDEMLDENLRKWFKEKWVRFGPDGKIRGDCARGDDSEGKPKCLPQSKAHALGKKGRASAAARKRREDPNPERSGKAINVNTKKKTDEEQLDEKCWDTHKQVGMKKKGGKMVPNCVPKESVGEDQAPMFTPEMKCPHCHGEMVSEELMNEKKDACYYKVKSRYKVWPSAYASGALVKCRKKGASNWGTGGKKNEGIEEDTSYAGGMGQGGNAGQSYRKYKVKPSGIGQGISETEAVNRNDGDGWRWYDVKPAGK